jgi:hypothetical protein
MNRKSCLALLTVVTALVAVPVGLAQIPGGNPTDELPPVPNPTAVQSHVLECVHGALDVAFGASGTLLNGNTGASWVPYWLGPSFTTPGGTLVVPTYAEARCDPATSEAPFAQNQSVAVYGQCDPYDDYTAPSPTSDTTNLPEPGACLPPVQVESGPHNDRNYTLYTDGQSGAPYPYTATTATTHGYPAASFDGGTIIEVYVDSSNTTVSITGEDPAVVRKAADSIKRIPSKDWVPDAVCMPSPGRPCIVGLPAVTEAARGH